MTQTILTFGDSNTHGTPPMTDRLAKDRFGIGIRWPTVTHATLGPDWLLVEDGLPGRTTAHSDPLMGPHMNGQLGLRIALEAHGPIDRLVIMLGTNDLKAHFGLTPEGITGGVGGLLGIAQSDEYQARHGGFDILLICPPPVLEQGPISDNFYGAHAKSVELPALFAALAARRSVDFLDAGQHISASPVDGVHFSKDAHIALGLAVGAVL